MKKILSIITILCLILLVGCTKTVHPSDSQITVGHNSIKSN